MNKPFSSKAKLHSWIKRFLIVYIYIYIKPNLLNLPQFSMSALFIKIKLLKINKTLNTLIMSNPISISPQNKPDNLQLLNNTRYKLKHHTLLSLPLSLLQTQTQPSKHCKTHTLLFLSLSLYPSPSLKPKRQSDLTDRLSWDIGTNQVSETKTIPLERGCNYFS